MDYTEKFLSIKSDLQNKSTNFINHVPRPLPCLQDFLFLKFDIFVEELYNCIDSSIAKIL